MYESTDPSTEPRINTRHNVQEQSLYTVEYLTGKHNKFKYWLDVAPRKLSEISKTRTYFSKLIRATDESL